MCWREAGSAGAGWRFCLSQPTQLCGGGWRTFLGDLLLPKYLGAAATPAAGRVVVVGCAEGSCVSRSGPREESCVWWAVGSGPKRVLREEEKCRGGKKLFTRGYGGDTGVNFSGSPEEAEKEKKKRAPLCSGCHRHGTLRSGAVCCYSYVLVTVIWLLLKTRANSACDH